MPFLSDFKTKAFSQNGLARSSKWLVRIHPPRGLSSLNAVLGRALSTGGNNVDVNIPILNAAEASIDTLNNIGVDFGSTNIGFNPNIPTLGYTLSGMREPLENLNLFTSDVEIPSRDIASVDYKQYGESRKIGFNSIYVPLSLQYYCSEDMREKKFFDQWMDIVFNTRNGSTGYYDDYIATFEIIKYNAGFTKIEAIYKFNEVYPTNIGTLSLASEEGQILKLAIQLNYRNYERTE